MNEAIRDLVTRARLSLYAAEPSERGAWTVKNNEVNPDNPQGDLFVGGGSRGAYPIMVDGTTSHASDLAWFIAEAPSLIRRLCDALDSGSQEEPNG